MRRGGGAMGRGSRLVVFGGALWLCAAVAGAGETVRLACWNVRNYLIDDRIVEGQYRSAYPKPEEEKTALRTALHAVRPDVLLLQEIGDEPFLRELQRDLAAEGLAYPYRHVLDGPDEQRHLAVLSRLPFTAIVPHPHLPIRYRGEEIPVKRGLLEIIFETAGERWHLFNLHLKSRFTNFPEDPQSADRRNREATAIRETVRAVLREDPARVVVVGGDFNDGPASRPLARFLEINRRPFLSPVAMTDPRGDRWTHFYPRAGVYSQIDFFLLSPAAVERMVEGSGRIIDTPAVRAASDHRLLVLEMRFGGQK
ncbi:MAG: endonuclease/exonuclease/phosphatase family protein [Verrucomicrobiota bacterium]